MKIFGSSTLGDLCDTFLSPHGSCVVIEFFDQCGNMYFPESFDVLFLGWSGVAGQPNFEKSQKMRNIGIELSDTSGFPELIVLDKNHQNLFLVAFDENNSFFAEPKKQAMDEALNQCDIEKVFITVFADRHGFSEVADQIAWGTKVWIANEPDHMIHYDDKPVIQAR